MGYGCGLNKMVLNLLQELVDSKKELVRCYEYILKLQEILECFPREEILKSIRDLNEDIELISVDLNNKNEN